MQGIWERATLCVQGIPFSTEAPDQFEKGKCLLTLLIQYIHRIILGGTVGTRDVSLSTKPGESFQFPGDPVGEADKSISQHSGDYSLVTEENPAKPGETVIAFLTGIPAANRSGGGY